VHNRNYFDKFNHGQLSRALLNTFVVRGSNSVVIVPNSTMHSNALWSKDLSEISVAVDAHA
jgi:hypothetical protein